MNFTCNECNDSGSRDKLGTYLDCNACGTAATRRDLSDFVKSLGPTHPEDVALAIHQRALAMAPKQEAPVAAFDAATFIENKAAKYLDENASTDPDDGSTIFHYGSAGSEYYNGIVELAEEIRIAAPAAANGALTDAQVHQGVMALLGCTSSEVEDYSAKLYEGYANDVRRVHSALAAAGPDAALVALIHKAQSILAQHLPPDGPDAKTTISELLGLLDGPESRAALSGAKGN